MAAAAHLEVSWSDPEAVSLLAPEARAASSSPGSTSRLAWYGVLCWAAVATLLAARGPASSVGVADLSSLQGLAEAKPKQAEAEDSKRPSLYSVYEDTLQHAIYVDLTHAFSPKSPVWPGFGHADFGASAAGAPMEGFVAQGQEFTYLQHGFQAGTYFLKTDQYGTQLDPPAHWNEFGATISDVPATVAVRPLVVLDVHAKVQKNASYHATVADAKVWETKNGRIPEGSVVMIRSDWYKGWQNFTDKGLPDEYAGVTIELLKFLHKERSILFHGHEPLDVDMTEALVGEAWLMHSNFMQAEGIANLDKVPEYGCLVSIGFAKPEGGLGGFARYIAICPAKSDAVGELVKDAPGAPLPQHKHPLRRNADGILAPDATADGAPTAYCSVQSALGCVAGKPSWEE